jgi:hypothetical protein
MNVRINNLNAANHPHPPCGFFIALNNEAQRPSRVGERCAIFLVRQENRVVRIAGIEVGQRKTDGISVASANDDDQAQGAPAEFFPGWGASTGKDFRHGHTSEVMRLFVMRIDELDLHMGKPREVVGSQDDIRGWGRSGQKWRGTKNARDTAKEDGQNISHAATVVGGKDVVQSYFCLVYTL